MDIDTLITKAPGLSSGRSQIQMGDFSITNANGDPPEVLPPPVIPSFVLAAGRLAKKTLFPLFLLIDHLAIGHALLHAEVHRGRLDLRSTFFPAEFFTICALCRGGECAEQRNDGN